MSQIKTNTTDLQAILAQVNALPDASGSAYTVYIGTTEPTSDIGVDGDIYIIRSDVT